mmetsp:Transcript_41554/g.120368  ORF Transcript_41554/g.120368 Transcript_41554/m.120368 type:complete len:253 (-) Transcript_41554:1555-2313(-)
MICHKPRTSPYSKADLWPHKGNSLAKGSPLRTTPTLYACSWGVNHNTQAPGGMKIAHHIAEPTAPTRTSVSVANATSSARLKLSISTTATRSSDVSYCFKTNASAASRLNTWRFCLARAPRRTTNTRMHVVTITMHVSMSAARSALPQTRCNNSSLGTRQAGKFVATAAKRSKASQPKPDAAPGGNVTPHCPEAWQFTSSARARRAGAGTDAASTGGCAGSGNNTGGAGESNAIHGKKCGCFFRASCASRGK